MNLPPSTPDEPRCYTIRNGIVDFYVVTGPEGLICIDAGWSRAGLSREFRRHNLDTRNIQAVFLTHLHWDHARGAHFFPDAKKFAGTREPHSIFSPRYNTSQPIHRLADNETVIAAGLHVRALETPGHTAGSLSYIVNDQLLFTGDTLRLRHGEALPFWPWIPGNRTAMRQSIRRLSGLTGISTLLTAHTGTTRDLTTAFRRWIEPPATGKSTP
jgi:glyoxylase-like metal-dependent hydrolase (beta-lactamase superfamily II)